MTSFSTPKTGPLTKEYEAGYVRNFGTKADRYCERCGKLPAWCECPKTRIHDIAAAVERRKGKAK